MKRRTFLKTTLATAGGLVLGVGCASPVASTGDAGDAGWAGDAGSDVGPDLGSDVGSDAGSPTFSLGEKYFPQSVMSGDPTPDGVILWTRAAEASLPAGDVALILTLATDSEFSSLVELDGGSSLALTAESANDHCVRVRLTGLEARTTYYYRFSIEVEGETFVSRTGRTRTAPALDSEEPVRFAYVSCQDYNGRFFNPYALLAHEDIDFIVHLGDYVYETTGNPEFQNTEGRRVEFSQPGEAIVFYEGEEAEYHAAKSLSNYRDLYKVYRSDEAIQRVHELFPMICIWDDHEFSNDGFGATATYFDDAQMETDVPRRKSANQAFYEFMPIDYAGDPDFHYDPSADFPGDIRIHRDLRFGKHMHLVLTDLRTYRTDHVIPEGGFPGEVIATEAQLIDALGELPVGVAPYVADIATFAGGLYADVLKQASQTLDFEESDVQGPIGASFINTIVAGVNDTLDVASQVPLIDDAAQETMERGLFYALTGKGFYADLGSRFLAIREPFEAICRYRFVTTNGASEETMGAEQEAWFLDTVKGSDATWKIWGNEFCLNSLNVDLTSYDVLPPDFRQNFSLIVEDWTGMPNKRDELIAQLAAVGNVVAITGDIHAFFAATPMSGGDPSKKIVELVTSSISSSSLRSEFIEKASTNPTLAAAGAPALAFGIVSLLQDPDAKPSPQLAHANITDHGYVVMEVGGDSVDATFRSIPGATDLENLYDEPDLASQFTDTEFKVKSGLNDLFHEVDGTLKRWDPVEATWVE